MVCAATKLPRSDEMRLWRRARLVMSITRTTSTRGATSGLPPNEERTPHEDQIESQSRRDLHRHLGLTHSTAERRRGSMRVHRALSNFTPPTAEPRSSDRFLCDA